MRRRKVLAQSVRFAVELLESRTLLSSTLALSQGTASITGVAFNDIPGTGVQVPSDPVLSGATVTIMELGTVYAPGTAPSVQTNVNGQFFFTGLSAGRYDVNITPDPGYLQDSPGTEFVTVAADDTASVALGETNNASGGDTGTATITGTLFDDVSQSGIYQQGVQAFLAGDTVYLDLNGSGVLTPNDPTAITGNVGQFSFAVTPGSYVVRVIPRPGFHQDPPGYAQVTVYSGQTVNQNIGENNLATLSGTVFVDTNGNGVQDAGELPVAGETVFIDESYTGVINPGTYDPTTGAFNNGDPYTTTTSTGEYFFTGLTAGTYRIMIDSAEGLVQDAPGFVDVTLTAGENLTQNLGEGVPSSISGTVFDDRKGDGVMDPGDSGLPNQQVFIDLNSNGVYDIAGNATDGLRDNGLTMSYTLSTDATVTLDGQATTLAALNSGDALQLTLISGTNTVSAVQASDQFKIGAQGDPFGAPGYGGTLVSTNGDALTMEEGEPTYVSDVNGNYIIGNLGPGTYTARVITPDGAIPTGPANATHSITFTISSNETLTGQNFGFETPDLTTNILSLPTATALTTAKRKAVVRITDVGSLPCIGLAGVNLWAQTIAGAFDSSTAFLVDGVPGRYVDLKVGQSKTFSFSFNYPTQLQQATYYVSAQVVSDVHDNNSANDYSPTVGPLVVIQPYIDLSLAYAAMPTNIVNPGQSTPLSFSVTNNGNVTTTGLLDFRLYLTTAPAIEPTDVAIQTNQFKNVRIKAGATKIFDIILHYPGQDLGFRYINAYIDSGDLLGETDLLNNTVIDPNETRFD